jgi:hypothetical protein
MKQYWNNLRPLEKRLVVAVGSALFVVLNLWLVVPHFGDWSATQTRLDKSRKKLDLYNAEIGKKKTYEMEVAKYTGEALDVNQEDQANHFSTSLISLMAQNNIPPGTSGRIKWDTNQFFLELSQTITIACREQQLVNFLHELGAGASLVRVRGLTLHPDPPHQQLMASITAAGSYQRKMPAKGVSTTPAATKPSAPAQPPPKTNPQTKQKTPELQKPTSKPSQGGATPSKLPGKKP